MEKPAPNPRVGKILESHRNGKITPGTAKTMLDALGKMGRVLEEDVRRAKVEVNLHETFRMMHDDRQQPGGQNNGIHDGDARRNLPVIHT